MGITTCIPLAVETPQKMVVVAISGFLLLQSLLIQAAPGSFTPEIKRVDCPDEDSDLCLEVRFQTETDIAELDQKFEGDFSNYEGYFMNSGVRVFASMPEFNNKMMRVNSMLHVSFVDPRSSQKTMFEVDPIQGVQDRVGSRHHIPDIVEISPYGKSFVKSNISIAATNFPSNGFDLKLHVFYSKSFNDKFGSGTKSKIDTLMGHSKTIMTWSSLDAKMKLSYTTEYLENEMDFTSLSDLSDKYVKNTNTDADLYVFLTDITSQGWVGVAYVGVLCGSKQSRVSISAYYSNDIYTAETITHEIGHNLNMEHDFYCKPSTPDPTCDRFCATDSSQTCTNIGSNMDYYEDPIDKWSCCSNADFAELYNGLGSNFCLSSGPPGPPTAPPPTTPPPSGCEFPNWATDAWCDDGNNNAECNWDGGACCPPHESSDWNEYCDDCECLGGPTTGGPTTATPAPCDDIWKAKKCNKMKKKGKCEKPKVEKKCKKTCGFC